MLISYLICNFADFLPMETSKKGPDFEIFTCLEGMWNFDISSNFDAVFLVDIKLDLYFDFLQIIYDRFIFKYTKIYFKFSIEIEVKSREYLLTSLPSIIKCQDVRKREYC